jgi:phosphomannomutase
MGLFKAYDIRGLVPQEFHPPLAFRIGWAFARHLAEDGPAPRVAVGLDARPTGPELAAAFMDGLRQGGADPDFIGPCSTPMLYWAVAGRDQPCRGGAMITASHNPAGYNGIKFCRQDAIPIAADTGLQVIETLTAQAPEPPAQWDSRASVNLLPPARPETDYLPPPLGFDPVPFDGYMRHVRRSVRRVPEGLRVACDPANGMGGVYLPLLRALGLELLAIHTECDGTFPNHEANPSRLTNLKPLQELVRREQCALGVAFDGDADRAVFVDETGAPVGQDLITALIAQEFLRRHKGASILYDLRSSRAVPEAIEAAGGRAVRERVGHSFMKATMRKVGCVFGGELAGHYYFRDNFFADSAILAVIEVLNALGQTGARLSELIYPLRKYAQTGEVNFHVEDKEALFRRVETEFADATLDHLDGVTVQYPDWWFNLRASNTEPLVRLNLEAQTLELLKEKLTRIADILGQPED